MRAGGRVSRECDAKFRQEIEPRGPASVSKRIFSTSWRPPGIHASGLLRCVWLHVAAGFYVYPSSINELSHAIWRLAGAQKVHAGPRDSKSRPLLQLGVSCTSLLEPFLAGRFRRQGPFVRGSSTLFYARFAVSPARRLLRTAAPCRDHSFRKTRTTNVANRWMQRAEGTRTAILTSCRATTPRAIVVGLPVVVHNGRRRDGARCRKNGT